jgi:hypothetical protein
VTLKIYGVLRAVGEGDGVPDVDAAAYSAYERVLEKV